MKIVPVNDLVLIRVAKAEEYSKGGVAIPDAAREQQSRGEILACGPGAHTPEGVFVPMKAEVGQVVIFARFHGWNDVDKALGEDLALVREGSILARLEP